MIKALENIRHDGVMYKYGDVIEKINEEEAERLVRLGVALFVEENSIDKKEIDLKSQLDRKFNATELKEVAEALEIEFPGNVSKIKLIELIIELNKVEEALEIEFIEEE